MMSALKKTPMLVFDESIGEFVEIDEEVKLTPWAKLQQAPVRPARHSNEFTWTAEEARKQGAIGGTRRKQTQSPEKLSEIGRKEPQRDGVNRE